jgi:peptide deformylase
MLKLIQYPNTILKTKAEDWQFQTDQDIADAQQTEIEMLALMKASNGIGLAAQQAGLLKRVFVMQTQDGREFGVFNPVVTFTSETMQEGQEGCLSFPELWLDIKRPMSIDAEYIDRNGKECIISFVGLDARVFLHELDHLNGVCFTDDISPLKLAMARKKQQKTLRKYNG